MLQKLSFFFEWVILSYKNQVLSSFSAFYKKIVLPTSIMEQLNVRFLSTIAAKVVFWVGYTFLQKPSSFKFLSNLEENCGADINNGTIKCKFLLTNVSQNVFWVSYTFLQKLSSFKFYSILDENCVVNIINGAIKCKTFVDNCCKNCVWVSYTFLQRPSLLKHFWIWPSFSRNFFVCKINDFGEINFWRFWWRRNVMRKKFHLLIK